MAPGLDPSVPLTLDRPRQVRLGIKALREAELMLGEVYGRKVSILRVMPYPEDLTLNDIVVILWAGLHEDDPALTIATVERLVNMQNLPDILQAMYAAWNLHTAAAAPAPEGVERPLATAFPGSDSGALPGSSLASATMTSGD